jgi:hypothetical protein
MGRFARGAESVSSPNTFDERSPWQGRGSAKREGDSIRSGSAIDMGIAARRAACRSKRAVIDRDRAVS